MEKKELSYSEIEKLIKLCESRMDENQTKYFVLHTILQSPFDEYEDQGITPERHTFHQSLRTDITALLESDKTDQTVKANVLIKHFIADRG